MDIIQRFQSIAPAFGEELFCPMPLGRIIR